MNQILQQPVIQIALPIIITIVVAALMNNKGIDGIHKRLDDICRRLDAIEFRLGTLETRVGGLERKGKANFAADRAHPVPGLASALLATGPILLLAAAFTYSCAELFAGAWTLWHRARRGN